MSNATSGPYISVEKGYLHKNLKDVQGEIRRGTLNNKVISISWSPAILFALFFSPKIVALVKKLQEKIELAIPGTLCSELCAAKRDKLLHSTEWAFRDAATILAGGTEDPGSATSLSP